MTREQEPEPLAVVYKMIQQECLAIFPTMPSKPGTMCGYAHIGQHFEADLLFLKRGRLATEAEYRDLHKELSTIYAPEYTLEVRKHL